MYRNLNIPQPNLTDRKTNTFRTFKKQILTFFQVCYIFCLRIYCTINIYLSPNVNGIKNIFYNFEDDKDLKTSRKEEKHHYNLYFIPLIKTIL